MRNSSISNKNSKQTLQNVSNILKYQNQYQNYEEELFQYKSKNTLKQSSNHQWNQYQSQSQLLNNSTLNKQKNQITSTQIQTQNNNSDKDLFSRLSQKDKQKYKSMTVDQLKSDLKEMRQQFQDMNKKLNEMLDFYNMSKAEAKQPCEQSQPQFYEKQISTNKRIEQAQKNQLKKLSKIENQVKDKDILLQLQQLVFEFQKQIHMKQKEQHHHKVKNHKLDRKLDEQIICNQENQDSNYVKILKLQIVYYLKKQHDLKFHDEQLDHSKKLLLQNDQTLSLKLNQYNKIAQEKKLQIKRNQPLLQMKKKYHELIQQTKTLKKRIQSIQRSNDIFEQKQARKAIQHKNQIIKVINPQIERLDIQNQDMNIKIKAIMQRYGILDNALQDVKYKFSEDITFHSRYVKEDVTKLLKNNIKPNFRISSKNSGYKSIDFEGMNISKTARKLSQNQKLDKTAKSNIKILNFNDKNVSLNLEENYQEQPSQHKFKPKINMKNISKTIDLYKKDSFNTQISPILLKPRMNLSKK